MKTKLVLLTWLVVQTAVASYAAGSGGNQVQGVSLGPDAVQVDDLTNQAAQILAQAKTPDDYHRAADLLQSAVNSDPNNLDARLTLGWVYLDRLHDPRAAYPQLAIVAKWRSNDLNAIKLFALACSQTGREEKAVEEFRQAEKLAPQDFWVRANLARALARTGHWHEAETIYDDILKTDPANEDARLGKAELEAWRGESSKPLKELSDLSAQDPTNVDALVLKGNIEQWNWRLTEAERDYNQALNLAPGDFEAKSGLEQARHMGAPYVTAKAYQFTDDTDFSRSSAGVDAHVPLADEVYLNGGADGWRYSDPGFTTLYRIDGHAGLDVNWNRWFETSAEGDVFNQARYLGEEKTFWGGQFSSRISPLPGHDIYLAGGLDQPFVSSMQTVTNGLKQSSLGGGLDFKIIGPLSVQDSYEWARISDGNHWWEDKPQLSLQVLHVPATYIRAQYDYLSYAQAKTNYWTPDHWRTLAPALSTSLPLGTWFHFNVDGSVPYAFDVGKFGYQLDGGPVLNLGRWVEIGATGYDSHIPVSQVTWSGNGWQAYVRIFF
jgi:tetratricopeptide (TPR) repeat protein